ncbi:hypothetical protein MYP_654 [Sporocytophaga myxococcoides]|uniref:Uncharacterized protein n=1 Tax=Sporocytophaga myxococcoides TaxID=153721 RepID=A0A098LAG8_9BACT|nr:hypothetical protein [Sporocytophaga myxococcoides]GAL83427.1 hypothetical protein MYP_654 [Sporocytophaga myxococcoides]
MAFVEFAQSMGWCFGSKTCKENRALNAADKASSADLKEQLANVISNQASSGAGTNTSLMVGLVIGFVLVMGIILFLIFRKKG